MPFTFSHPAIVLPLTYLPKKWFSLTGLVIGAFTPDFEYFLRMNIRSSYSHTISGIFWFDLPLGLLFAFLFHNIIRDTLFDNLPTVLRSRFSVFKQFDWNEYFKDKWFVVIISILIGTASHVFWDSFTHSNRYFVQIIPILTYSVDFLGRQVPLFNILQHTSSIIGAIVIVFSIRKLPMNKIEVEKINLNYWIIIMGMTLAIITVRFLSGLEFKQYENLIMTSISAGMISLILTPMLIKEKSNTQTP